MVCFCDEAGQGEEFQIDGEFARIFWIRRYAFQIMINPQAHQARRKTKKIDCDYLKMKILLETGYFQYYFNVLRV